MPIVQRLHEWVQHTRRMHPDVEVFDVLLVDGRLKLDLLIVKVGGRKKGKGSAIMHDLTYFADAFQLVIVLSLMTGHNEWGTTSRTRLIQFYKRFGFVENRGKSKDYRLGHYTSMYRKPEERTC